jgi:hypothetical protein
MLLLLLLPVVIGQTSDIIVANMQKMFQYKLMIAQLIAIEAFR